VKGEQGVNQLISFIHSGFWAVGTPSLHALLLSPLHAPSTAGRVASPREGKKQGMAVQAPTGSPRPSPAQHQLHTTPSLIPTVDGNTVRSFSTYGHQSAAQGSSTTVSRSDIRLIQYLDSSALGLVRRWLLIGYFPIHLLPHTIVRWSESQT
jgi:hypothetical protein